MDLEDIRRQLLAQAEVMGWPALAERIGAVKSEALRVFAVNQGKGMHPDTKAAVEAYLSGGKPLLTPREAKDAEDVLRLLRRAVETQEVLVARLQASADPRYPENTAKPKGAAKPHPGTKPSPKSRRRAEGG